MRSPSELIESLAGATAHCDRDQIDLLLARLLHDYVDAAQVASYRLVEDAAVLRVQRRLLIDRDGREFAAVQPLSGLPALRENARWYECCALSKDVVHYPTGPGGANLGTVFALRNGQSIVGLIEIEVDAPRACLRPREIRLIAGVLRLLGNHLAVLDYGQRDTLTGLLNRKTFDHSFHKVLERVRSRSGEPRAATPGWFAIVDVDRFKSINDRFGHLFGDDVLLLLARMMRHTFRNSDQLFRFGGEEFVIVLEGDCAANAEAALDRLRRRVAEHAFPQVGRVTVSIGYTRIGPADPAVSCFDRADAALYYAKEHGRNQIRCYETLIASGDLRERAEAEANVEFF